MTTIKLQPDDKTHKFRAIVFRDSDGTEIPDTRIRFRKGLNEICFNGLEPEFYPVTVQYIAWENLSESLISEEVINAEKVEESKPVHESPAPAVSNRTANRDSKPTNGYGSDTSEGLSGTVPSVEDEPSE